MSDDHWQRELAQVNRDQQEEERRRLDERWDRLSHGELSADEEAELRALAETSEEAHEAYEAFRPLGPDFQASVVRAIQTQGLAPKTEPASTERPAKLLPFRRRFVWSAVAAVAAAACVVVLLRPPAPLPGYSSPKVSRGVSAFRGEDSESTVLAPGDRFQVIVRPETAVSRGSRLEALCFLARGGDLRVVDIESEIDPGGSVKMNGSLERDIPPGTWTLWAVVGRRGKLPDPADLVLLSAGARARERDWVAVEKMILIQRPRAPDRGLEDSVEN
jgi:hypothetical protein